MMHWYYGSSGWGYALMVLSMLLFWGLVITGVVLLVRGLSSDRQAPQPPGPSEEPRRVLAERYARGEIDETDYRQRMKVLSGS